MQDDEVCKVTDDTRSVYKRSETRAVNVQNACLARDLNYSDYLQLDKVLDAQVHSLKTLSRQLSN
jgi:hypothetical protein